MATYDWLFNVLGLRKWCDAGASDGPMSMAQLPAKTGNAAPQSGVNFAFPSLDELNKACGQISQTRDVVKGLENGFLAIRPALRTVLDPITQPLSWMLDMLDQFMDWVPNAQLRHKILVENPERFYQF